MNTIELTEDEWDAKYVCWGSADGPLSLDRPLIKAVDPHHVWTYCDTGDGGCVTTNGFVRLDRWWTSRKSNCGREDTVGLVDTMLTLCARVTKAWDTLSAALLVEAESDAAHTERLAEINRARNSQQPRIYGKLLEYLDKLVAEEGEAL